MVRKEAKRVVLKDAEGDYIVPVIDPADKGANIDLSNLSEEGKAKLGKGGLELCDIGMALYVDETKGKRRYLNGQIVDINTNTQAFLNRLKQITTLHPSLLCTEEEWQSAKTMSAFGQVGKFVFNHSGENIVSVRIPRVVNVQGLFDLQNLGMTVDAGLPNITGTSNGYCTAGVESGTNVSGCIYPISYKSGQGATNNGGWSAKFGIDASRSSSIYGSSTTVQQEAIQYPYFIQIATGSETENNIINDIELNNPYSLFDSKYSDHELNNLSWLKSEGQWNAKAVYTDAYDKLLKVYNGTETVEGLSVKLSTETYTDYDFVLNTTDETFRLPLKTNLASGKAVVGNGMTLGLTDNTLNLGLRSLGGNSTGHLGADAESYGTNINSTTGSTYPTGNRTIGVTTDPTKSGIELSDSGLYLYFYVGETVQNANLIDAGRIGEQVASLTAQPHIIETYQNGTSGYRIWSDGYCEQWGVRNIGAGDTTATLSFTKTFKDTNYKLIVSYIGGRAGSWGNTLGATKTSNTQFKIIQGHYGDTVGLSVQWNACGYLLEGQY